MIEMLRDLFQYQAWADSQIVAAIKAHAPAAEDEELRKTLHHILVVQRFFVQQCAGQAFDTEREMRVPSTIDEMEKLFCETHAQEVRFMDALGMDALGMDALGKRLDRPPLDKMRPTVRTALTQTVLHSQHHRGQVATRLRALGAAPPTVDYILWAKDRP